MKPVAPKAAAAAPENEATGVPGFRTWPAVYWFVLGVFAVVVGLLCVLTQMFS